MHSYFGNGTKCTPYKVNQRWYTYIQWTPIISAYEVNAQSEIKILFVLINRVNKIVGCLELKYVRDPASFMASIDYGPYQRGRPRIIDPVGDSLIHEELKGGQV